MKISPNQIVKINSSQKNILPPELIGSNAVVSKVDSNGMIEVIIANGSKVGTKINVIQNFLEVM